MNYYEKLRSHYYTLFPEEKKLEFGCEVADILKANFEGDYWWGQILTVNLHCGGCHVHKTIRGCNNSTVDCDVEDKYDLLGGDGLYEDIYVSSVWSSDIYDEKKYKILGKPLTLYHATRLVKDKHELLDKWGNSPLLSEQSEELHEYILDNLLTI